MRQNEGVWIALGLVTIIAIYKGLQVLFEAMIAAPFPSAVHYNTGLGLLTLFLVIQLSVGQALKRMFLASLVLLIGIAGIALVFRLGNGIGRLLAGQSYEWKAFASGFLMQGETSTFGMLGGGIVALIIAYSSLLGLFETLFKGRSKPIATGERHLRGRGLISFGEAKAIAAKKTEGQRELPFFGLLHIPERAATTHFAFVGTTGSGKTLSLRMLMESVLPRQDSTDRRALIYDAKQDMLSILYGMELHCPIHILNPFDTRCSAWDMAKDITAPSAAEQVATILIPEEKNSSSPYFSDAARALMAGAIIALMRTAPMNWEFRDVIYVLRNAERLKKLLAKTRETEDLVAQYFANERTANDVISTIATKIQRYQYVAAAWHRAEKKISLVEWVSTNSILVLGNDEATRSALDAINRVIFKRVTELVLAQSESESRRTWFFLDELRHAGKLDGLNSLLTMGRSKGACVAIGFQDLEGLSAVYGEKEAAEVVGLCANKAILRLDSPHTAKWAASVLGEKEVLETRASSGNTSGESHGMGLSNTTSSQGESNSVSEQIAKRDVILGSEFLDLPPTSFETGLPGTYVIPEIGAYRVITPGDWLRALKPPCQSTPNLVRRSAEDEVLAPWEEEDYRRLGLPFTKEALPSATLEPEESTDEDAAALQAAKDTAKGEANFQMLMKMFKDKKR